jgi:hypothetical protein
MKHIDFNKIASKICESDVKGSVRTAGQIEFKKDRGPIRRDIRAPGFKWSPESLRNLAKILWAIQRSNSYTMAAYRVFSKMNSSDFSPDGLLGGRGYIQAVKDMRKDLASVVEVLSAFADTVQDEIDADHWKETEPDQETTELVEDAQNVKGNPDEYVEDEYSEVAPEDESEYDLDLNNPSAEDMNPSVDDEDETEEDEFETQSQFASLTQPLAERYDYGQIKPKKKKDDEPASQLPTDTGEQGAAKTETESFMNTTTPDHGNYATAFKRMLTHVLRQASVRVADSSLPVDTMSGPRVDHIGPGEGNADGFYNDEDIWSSDDPTGDGLSSGTNETKPVYEDWIADGISPYDNPTQGDESVLQISSKVAATYSWLPGADNSKNLDYYKLGLSEDDINYMRANSDPDPPAGYLQPKKKIDLWEPRS